MTNEEINYQEENAISLKECAKILGIKSTDFIKYLLDNKYIYKTNTVKKNKCYKEYSTDGGNNLFYLKIFKGGVNIQTTVTPIGVEYFKKLIGD